jgi:four helix bundle protein
MITSYRELRVWQKADELANKVFELTGQFEKKYLYDLTNQLRRASLSVPTNIVEGCASFHTKEFLQFLNIARRSSSETSYLLDFAYRRRQLNEDQFKELSAILDSLGKMLNSLITSLKAKKASIKS